MITVGVFATVLTFYYTQNLPHNSELEHSYLLAYMQVSLAVTGPKSLFKINHILKQFALLVSFPLSF